MVEETYLWACQTIEAEKDGWEQVDTSGNIKVQSRLELDKNCLYMLNWNRAVIWLMDELTPL